MKKFKMSTIAIIALVLGIAANAFTMRPAEKTGSLTMHYIQFTGPDNSDDEIQSADNWTDLGTQPPTLTCNAGTGIVCYVQFNGDLDTFDTYVSDKTLSDLVTAGIIDKYRTS
jgi:hypothetical protein